MRMVFGDTATNCRHLLLRSGQGSISSIETNANCRGIPAGRAAVCGHGMAKTGPSFRQTEHIEGLGP